MDEKMYIYLKWLEENKKHFSNLSGSRQDTFGLAGNISNMFAYVESCYLETLAGGYVDLKEFLKDNIKICNASLDNKFMLSRLAVSDCYESGENISPADVKDDILNIACIFTFVLQCLEEEDE